MWQLCKHDLEATLVHVDPFGKFNRFVDARSTEDAQMASN